MAEVPGGPTAWAAAGSTPSRAAPAAATPGVHRRAWTDRPLDVLGHAQGLLDALAKAGQLEHLGVVQARPRPQGADRLPDDPPGGRVEPVGERRLDRARAQLQGHLVDSEPVGDLALDDRRAEPVGGLDGHLRGVAVQRVEGEQHRAASAGTTAWTTTPMASSSSGIPSRAR